MEIDWVKLIIEGHTLRLNYILESDRRRRKLYQKIYGYRGKFSWVTLTDLKGEI